MQEPANPRSGRFLKQITSLATRFERGCFVAMATAPQCLERGL